MTAPKEITTLTDLKNRIRRFQVKPEDTGEAVLPLLPAIHSTTRIFPGWRVATVAKDESGKWIVAHEQNPDIGKPIEN